MKKEKGFAVVYLLIGIVILAVIGGIYFSTTKKNVSETNPKACTMEAKICPDGSSVGRSGANCEFSPCPAMSASITDWKTYKNTKYAYQVSYPLGWEYKTYNDDVGVYFSDPKKVLPLDTYPESLDLSVNVIDSKLTLDEYMEQINPSTGLKNKEIYKKTGETIIDGKNALVTYGGCCGDQGKHIFVKNQNYIFDIESIGANESPNFNNFLSTFKFIDQNQATPTASSSKTYCTVTGDCGVDTCNCIAIRKEFLGENSCTRFCPGKLQCLNNKCVLN